MTTIRLYSGPLSMFGAKAEIALLEKGLDFERIMVPFVEGDRLRDRSIPRSSASIPSDQVPVLIHGDVEVFDSTQIFEYLEDAFPLPRLWPPKTADRAAARQLELKADEVFFPHIITPDAPGSHARGSGGGLGARRGDAVL